MQKVSSSAIDIQAIEIVANDHVGTAKHQLLRTLITEVLDSYSFVLFCGLLSIANCFPKSPVPRIPQFKKTSLKVRALN